MTEASSLSTSPDVVVLTDKEWDDWCASKDNGDFWWGNLEIVKCIECGKWMLDDDSIKDRCEPCYDLKYPKKANPFDASGFGKGIFEEMYARHRSILDDLIGMQFTMKVRTEPKPQPPQTGLLGKPQGEE